MNKIKINKYLKATDTLVLATDFEGKYKAFYKITLVFL